MKLARNGSLFVLISVMSLLFGRTQNAFAQLSCFSEWSIHDGSAHCHMYVGQAGTETIEKLCILNFQMPDLESQIGCEAFCAYDWDPQILQGLLERVVLRSLKKSRGELTVLGAANYLALEELEKEKSSALKASIKVEALEKALWDLTRPEVAAPATLSLGPN